MHVSETIPMTEEKEAARVQSKQTNMRPTEPHSVTKTMGRMGHNMGYIWLRDWLYQIGIGTAMKCNILVLTLESRNLCSIGRAVAMGFYVLWP